MSLHSFVSCLVGTKIKYNDKTVEIISAIIENGVLVCVVGKSDHELFFWDKNEIDNAYECGIVNVRRR